MTDYEKLCLLWNAIGITDYNIIDNSKGEDIKTIVKLKIKALVLEELRRLK